MEAKINVPLATDGGLQAIKSEPTWCTAGWREITRLCLESALYLWVSYVLMVDYNVCKSPTTRAVNEGTPRHPKARLDMKENQHHRDTDKFLNS